MTADPVATGEPVSNDPPAPEPPKLDAMVIGRFGEKQLLEGWHEREVDQRSGVAYRAAHGTGHLHLRRNPAARHIYLLVSGPFGLTRLAVDGRLVMNKKKYQMPLEADAWVLRKFPIESDQRVLRIRLVMPEPVVPDKYLKNGDARALGWFLSAVWQE